MTENQVLKYLPPELYITFHNELIEELIVEIKAKPHGEPAFIERRKNLLTILTLLNALNVLQES